MTPVTMLQTRWGYFPKVFSVNGVEYAVQAIDKCWTVAQEELWFRVTCDAKTIDLYRDAKKNAWYVAQVQ